jgi:hypothetical protein
MISAYIFSGPTLPPLPIKEKLNYDLNEDRELMLDSGEKIKFMPPVSEGDILKLIPLKPKIIGIIDGYFEHIPSVWHKEILYAMSQGIYVLGASSIGALRAAELASFGMEGVGTIFQAFVNGFLEDDEVAVVHGPEELGFPLLSEAMINIRCTLDDARNQGILSPSGCEALKLIARNIHYKDRTYERIIMLAENQGLNSDWLRNNRKDQMLIDAIALLENVIETLNSYTKPKTVLYNFESTTVWNKHKTILQEM